MRAAAWQIVADWLTPFFKTYPEYQRDSIDSLVRDLNHWDGVPRPPHHTRLWRLVNKESPQARSKTSGATWKTSSASWSTPCRPRRGETVGYTADFACPLPIVLERSVTGRAAITMG